MAPITPGMRAEAYSMRESEAEVVTAQQKGLPGEGGGSELIGTWEYGDGNPVTKYTICRTVEGWLRVDEQLPTGLWVFGMLQPQGRWLQAKLCSSDGVKCGTMRIHYLEEDGTTISNVKAAGGAVWGPDTIGRREGRAAELRQPKPETKEPDADAPADSEAPSAADLLSQFFDAVGARESEAQTRTRTRAAAAGPGPRRSVQPTHLPKSEPSAVAIAVSDTAVVAALNTADPLAPFGYTVKRIQPSSGRMACKEATPAGAPLLALPLTACWTAAAARLECAPVAVALTAAARRNPSSSILVADHTWIALHLLHEKRQGNSARSLRKAHLAMLPESPETLLAWNSKDLEALHGSRWQELAKQRMVEVVTDFHTLVAELGPAGAADLGLSLGEYTWARQVIQQLGMYFTDRKGAPLLLLAPGLELLFPDQDVPPSKEGARLEFDAKSNATLVLYATKDLKLGDAVALSHAGIACSNGFRLLGRGTLLEANPFEAVEMILKIPVASESLSAKAELWEVLEGLQAALGGEDSTRPGDCLSTGYAEAKPLVEVAESRKLPEVRIRLNFTRERLLPQELALWYLGLTLTAHSERIGKIIEQEREVVNPLGLDACVRRALSWLLKRIRWAIEDGPSKPLEDAERISARHGSDAVLRRALALRLVAAERELLNDVAKTIQHRLAAPVATQTSLMVPLPLSGGDLLTLELLALAPGHEPERGSRLDAVLSQLRGCTQSLVQLAERFRTFTSSGSASASDIALAREEMELLESVLSSSPLEPMSVKTAAALPTTYSPASTSVASSTAALRAQVASLEWEASAAERGNQQQKLEAALVGLAKAKMRLLDFVPAQGHLQRCRTLQPHPSAELASLMRQCALSATVQSEKVLSGSWNGCGDVLLGLREKMKRAGYMAAGSRWPWPARLPPVENVAEVYQKMWDRGSALAKEAKKAQARVPASTWWVMKEARTDLQQLITLFELQRPLSVQQVLSLLGREACQLLLERRALSCYLAGECRILEPPEAVAQLNASSSKAEVVAMVSLWPVDDEVIVALDFDQSICTDTYEPVTYLAEDSKALLATASRQPAAKHLLNLCCGSGAHGIAALKRPAGAAAEQVLFLDSNQRALRFAQFGAALNGVEARASFHLGSICDDAPIPGGPFQAILAELPFLPNPAEVLSRAGPLYRQGGADGQRVLAALVSKTPRLLAAEGRATVTCMVKNADGLEQQLESSLDARQPAGFRAAAFRGEPLALEHFVGAATSGCNHAQRCAYYRGLKEEEGLRTMSEALLLFWAPRAGSQLASSKAEMRSEFPGLWSDQDYLWLELERFLLATGSGAPEELLYNLDWAEGIVGADAELTKEVVAAKPSNSAAAAAAASPWRTRISKDLQERYDQAKSLEGATWTDIARMQVRGQGRPPVLCDMVWEKSAGKLEKKGSSGVPHLYQTQTPPGRSPSQMALLELLSCECPQQVSDALRVLRVQDRLTFGDGLLSLYRNYFRYSSPGLPSDKVFLSLYDVLVIPLTGYQAFEPDLAAFTSELLQLLQAVVKQVHRRARPMRIVLLSCGSIGPGYIDWHGDDVPASAPILGLVRAMRCEIPQLPVIWVDSDALSSQQSGTPMTWIEQVGFELELATPKNGVWGVSTQERAHWLISNNRDVAYRAGKRYLPRLVLSPAMPIFPGRQAPTLPLALARGPVLVTGGVGGLGLAAAEALLELGAQHLVLSSRSGQLPPGLGLEDRLKAMRANGAVIDIEKCDTGKEKDVVALLERLRENHGSPAAIIHTSGVLAEKAFMEMDSSTIKRVWDPKAQGASFLHRHSLEDDISVFMMFSSTAALRGSKGQANYAAACAYLDELARLRVSQGLPAVSVQWPRVELSGDEVQSDLAMSVSLATAKQVVKQLVCGLKTVAPVQAVLPSGYTVPTTPAVASLLESLTRQLDEAG